MNRAIRLRPQAAWDLAEIWSYTEQRWDVSQAEAYIGQIRQRLGTITENPNLGSDCRELYPGLRRVKSGSHLIYYLTTGQHLDIVRILHERRDTSSLL